MGIPEDARVIQWTDRQLVRVIGPDGKAPFAPIEFQNELPRFQYLPVLVTQDGDEQFVPQIPAIRIPIDIEPACITRFRSPFEDVQPERIVGATHSHVIWHEIENLTE